MQHHIDGAVCNRTEKVAWLSQHAEECTDNLRVCWQGPELDRNCGFCEKCIRTKLNFWASGNAIPAAFPGTLTPETVASIKIDSLTKRRELESLYFYAQDLHPKNHPILKILKRKLTIAHFQNFISHGRELLSFALRGK